MIRIERSVPGGTMSVWFPIHGQESLVKTVFFDGCSSTFVPANCDENLHEAAQVLGYRGSWERFGIDHEMTHHFVAMALQWPCSTIVWQAAHKGRRPHGWRRDGAWPYGGWDEEHLVNRLLAHSVMGEADPEGIIEEVWGDRLPRLLSHLTHWIRPWVEAPSHPLPLPLDPDRVSFPLRQEEEDEVPMGRMAMKAWG